MSTKADLELQIAGWQKELTTKKVELNSLQTALTNQIQSAQDWIDSFRKDFFGKDNDCWGAADPASAEQYVSSGTKLGGGASYCHNDSAHTFNKCSKDGCQQRFNQVNVSLSAAINKKAEVAKKNSEIQVLQGLIDKAVQNITALPESQSQIAAAGSSAAELAKALKTKWVLFGVIAIVVIVGAIFLLKLAKS